MDNFYYHPDGIRFVDVGYNESDMQYLTQHWKEYVKKMLDFVFLFEDLEQKCLLYLSELRESDFYRKSVSDLQRGRQACKRG